ncbi:DUF3530 family protein [Cellvibrio sp. UBA7661]|uniref:DUF3530 family protein n=1 Tax=Cellvibrio sp. UBA7661 TaxID=1946311 RepID=UPI002F35A87F
MPVNARLRPIKHRYLNDKLLILLGFLWFLAASMSHAQEEPSTTLDANTESSTSGASSSARSSEPPLYPSRDIRDKTLIANAMDDEAQWLDTEHGKILALYRQTEARKTYGILVLFHATENPQSWPPILENLRTQLPRYGWETLAISLPQQYPAFIPARPSSSSSSVSASNTSDDTTANNQPADSSTTDENSTPTEDTTSASSSSAIAESASSSAVSSTIARDVLVTTYVNSAFEFLKSRGQFNTVVLVDNSSAEFVLKDLLPQIRDNPADPSTVDGPLQALVITNLQQQEHIKKAELEEIFSKTQLPVLDIFFSPDNQEQGIARDLHQATALRKKVIDYQQLLLDTQPKLVEQDRQSFLLGRIRGFMKQKATGSEVKTSNSTEN